MKKTLLALLISGLSISSSFAVETIKNKNSNTSTNNGNVSSLNNENTKYIIRVSHVIKSTTPKGQGAEAFKNYLEAAFPGRVEVKVYHDNDLFKDKEEIEALNLGAVDIILPTTSKVASTYKVKKLELLDLPYLFNSPEDINKFIKSNAAQKLMTNISETNNRVLPLAFWPNGFRQMIGKHELKTHEDFSKDVMRVESDSKVLSDMYSAFGAKSTIKISYGDLYNALNGNYRLKVDSTDNVLTNIFNSKLYEPSPVITMTSHNVMFYTFLVNARWYNSLPADIQDGIKRVAVQAGALNNKLANEEASKIVEDLKAKNVKVVELSKSEKVEVQNWMKPVHENYAKEVSTDLLAETYNSFKN